MRRPARLWARTAVAGLLVAALSGCDSTDPPTAPTLVAGTPTWDCDVEEIDSDVGALNTEGSHRDVWFSATFEQRCSTREANTQIFLTARLFYDRHSEDRYDEGNRETITYGLMTEDGEVVTLDGGFVRRVPNDRDACVAWSWVSCGLYSTASECDYPVGPEECDDFVW